MGSYQRFHFGVWNGEEESELPGDLNEEFQLSSEPRPERGKRLDHDFRAVIEHVARTRSSPLEVFNDFVRMAACALAAQTREEEYLAVAKNYSREELVELSKALALLTSEMESQPFTDVLGPYYTEIGSNFSRDFHGEFYTPKPVSDMIARMVVDVPQAVEEGRPVTISEPACGSGGMVLSLAAAFAEAKAVDLLRVTCQDISKTACDMAYINTTLWGIPARIVQGDTLRNTVEREWRNIHWFRVGEHQREQIEKMRDLLRSPVEPEAGPEPPKNQPPHKGEIQQQEWTFE